jgi:hypothetical protein
VAAGKAGDLPVYFGDAGSAAVLHSVGAERAACAVITLDTPGANYRSVWALHKHFPSIKTYVRAHDVNHGINLEKAGATVVVPETLEPSMQLAASVLSQFKLPPEEINTHLDNFRKKHLSELQALAAISGGRGMAWCGVVWRGVAGWRVDRRRTVRVCRACANLGRAPGTRIHPCASHTTAVLAPAGTSLGYLAPRAEKKAPEGEGDAAAAAAAVASPAPA